MTRRCEKGAAGTDPLEKRLPETWSRHSPPLTMTSQHPIRRFLVSGLMGLCRLLDPSAVFSSDMSLVIDRLQHRVDELEGRA
jgi:hypothetical protein